MNINDVDNAVAAVVLRRQQEIGAEQTANLVAKSLEGKLPEPLIQKTIDMCKELQLNSLPELNSIMEKLESGEASFDDTVIELMQFGMKLAQESTQKAQELVLDHIEQEQKEETQDLGLLN